MIRSNMNPESGSFYHKWPPRQGSRPRPGIIFIDYFSRCTLTLEHLMPHPKDDPMTVTSRGSFSLTESQSLRVSQFNYLHCWTEFQFSTVLLRVLKLKYSATALAHLRVKQPTCHGNVGGNRIRRKELDGRSNLTERQDRLGRTVGSARTRVYGKMPT